MKKGFLVSLVLITLLVSACQFSTDAGSDIALPDISELIGNTKT